MAGLICPRVIGRADELGALDTALLGALGRRGGAVVITGEAGIGKSRLVDELTDSAERHGVAVAHGRAVPTGKTEPFRPLTAALMAVVRERGLPDDDDELSVWIPALGDILPNVAERSEPARRDDTVAARGEAVLCLLRLLARDRALVVVLEDAHWADVDTLAVLEYMADHVGSLAILIVATYRTDETGPAVDHLHRLTTRGRVQHLALRPLDRDQVAEMATACDPDSEISAIERAQRAADGVPLLVEELLASPGVPPTLADTVRARLDAMEPAARSVLEAAAVLGTSFDWRILAPVTGQSIDDVSHALEQGVAALLLTFTTGEFGFRHALTRDAMVGELLPPRRAAIATAALAAIDRPDAGRSRPTRDVIADVALQAGDRDRAGTLLMESGRQSRLRGALATAIDAFRRAAELLGDPDQHAEAHTGLVEALALAGRVDEAMGYGRELIAELGTDAATAVRRAEIHLWLAHAAVDAARWVEAGIQVDAAKELSVGARSTGLAARVAVLEGEILLARDEIDRARELAESVVASADAPNETHCHAYELIGRCERIRDIDAARTAFTTARATAEAADLPVWRLRASHELGTIELFEYGRNDALQEARELAGALGALGTAAVLDIQLAAAASLYFDLDDMEACARAAADLSERLGLGRMKAAAVGFLAEVCAHRRDVAGMEERLALAAASAPGDDEVAAIAWACRGTLALLSGDRGAAVDRLGRAVDIARRLPQSPPGMFRGLWPLLLAGADDPRARDAVDEVRDGPAGASCWNRGIVAYADAILAGRRGDRASAEELARQADADLVTAPVWSAVARLHAAEAASVDGWGQPEAWLERAVVVFDDHGISALADRCRNLLGSGDRLSELGVTERERDVLDQVAAGLANKEIALELGVSPRTVEKHIESLLRKTGARSRTHLIAVIQNAADR